MSDLLYRATFDVEQGGDGRTVLGRAFFWDRPSMVRDPGSAPYREEFARGSVAKTLAEAKNGVFPLWVSHDYTRDPIGVVRFSIGEKSLDYEARLSHTRSSDEALELTRDGAFSNVSVAYRALKNATRIDADGPITVRSEIVLRELSLCPTGFNQHAGADVLALRSDDDPPDDDEQDDEPPPAAAVGTPRLDALRRRIILLS